MSTSLILTFNSVVAKYSRLDKKVRRIISTGLAAGLLTMGTGDAFAQGTPIGPFVENPGANPFPIPAFPYGTSPDLPDVQRRSDPALTFWDLDKDGDLDASMGFSGFGNTVRHFLNIGTKQRPAYKSYYSDGADLYWYSAGNHGRVAYADIDDDGDLDAVVGMDRSDDGNDDFEDDVLWFFRNTALNPTDPPNFSREILGQPFAGMNFKKQSWPAFTDYDKDGDLDFVLAGEYDDVDTEKTAWIQFFENKKDGHAPGVDVTYEALAGTANNPLYLGESVETITAGFFDIAFADLDGDGDDDFFRADQHGQIKYRRNDGGVYVEQTDEYVYKPGGQSTGNPLKIDDLVVAGPDQIKYLAFGDLDGDGDTDLVIGTNAVGTLNSPYIYVENTGNGVMVADRSFSNPISGFFMGNGTSVALFDFDNDGDQDLLTTGRIKIPEGSEGMTRDEINHLFFKNNNGKFEVQELLDDPFASLIVGGSEGWWQTVDVDGDKDIDAIFQNGSTITYYRNDGGTFTIVSDVDSPFKPILDEIFFGVEFDFGDLNGDHLPDVVAIGNSNTPYFFKNTGTIGNPVFVKEDSWRTGLTTELNDANPRLKDVDGDGDTDLILGTYANVYYFENQGNSTTPTWKEYQETYEQEGTTYNAENPFGYIEVEEGGGLVPDFADVDGDGDKDLFIANEMGGTFRFYQNNNPAPVVTATVVNSIEFDPSENDFKAILDPNITLTDIDGDKISLIRVTIEPYEQGKEKLDFEQAPPGVGSDWDDVNGVFTVFGGDGTVATYQEALRNIVYIRFGEQAGAKKSGRKSSGRTIAKTVNVFTLDADGTIAPSNTTVFSIIHSNNDPVITPGTFNATYTATPIAVIPTITLSDDDDLTLTSAQVKIDSGTYVPTEDQLTATFAGALTGSFNTANGVLQVSGSGTIAEYQQTLRSVAYTNVLGNSASNAPRILTIIVNDGETDSNIASVQLNISVTPPNSDPQITPGTFNATYTGTPVALMSAVTLSDADDPSLVSAQVKIDSGTYVPAQDRLTVTLAGSLSGTFDTANGVLLVSGNATIAEYQQTLRSIEYDNLLGNNATNNPRIVTIVVNDGTTDSNIASVLVDIDVTPPANNTPPTISGTATPFYISGEVVINNNIVLVDPDTLLTSASVVFTTGFAASEDQLLFTDQNGITGQYNSTAGLLSLSGPASVANYQAALRSVRYKNNSSIPSTQDRSITFNVSDGGPDVSLVTVITINKPPVITAANKKAAAGGNVAFSITQVLSDPDNNLDLNTLEVTSQAGGIVTIDGSVITIDYDPIANYKGNDVITISVCDTGGRCNTSTLSVEVGAAAVIYTGMSPNGDGINDWFYIQYLETGTQVAIYNRWGDAIFETDDYDIDDPAKRFEGKTKNGTEVVAGTYFYKVKFPNNTVKTGYLLLNR